MAQTIRDLETTGLVARRPDPDDGRRAFIDLTAEGVAALEADRRHRDGWLARILEAELTEQERAVLHDAAPLLRRIADA